MSVKAVEDLQSLFINPLPRNRMFRSWNNDGSHLTIWIAPGVQTLTHRGFPSQRSQWNAFSPKTSRAVGSGEEIYIYSSPSQKFFSKIYRNRDNLHRIFAQIDKCNLSFKDHLRNYNRIDSKRPLISPETVSQLLFCHPELVSGSRYYLILSDAETSSAWHFLPFPLWRHSLWWGKNTSSWDFDKLFDLEALDRLSRAAESNI